MTTSNTPGPWTSTKDSPHQIMQSGTYARIAKVCGYAPPTEDRANARLIAAAPDLLAALENLVETHDDGEAMHVEFWNIARAALAKAKGE